MYEIYSVESRKGGVGKTTIALNLAKALVKKKYDVLLIDCDITGTPISKAAMHSSFWSNDVSVSMKDGKPYNLIEFFNNVFLKGLECEQEIIDGLTLSQSKIHLIGSEIYDENSNLIIDPRDLMDDLHSYWFLDLIKSIAKHFCDSTKKEKKAIVLDNSPGYVGIGRSIREWLTKVGPELATFVLVSSLDEQDMDSTIDSADEIKRMMLTDVKASNYIKVLINKVPKELLTENNAYDFKVEAGSERQALVSELFPLGRDKYPKNIIKYDSAISGQFIEASLKPRIKKEGQYLNLVDLLHKFDTKSETFDHKADPYTDIALMDALYKKVLKALSDSGFVRMSNALGGDLTPNYMLKDLKEIVSKLGSMSDPEFPFQGAPKAYFRNSTLHDLIHFINRHSLAWHSALFTSLVNGLFKLAGIDRKGTSLHKLFNLHFLLEGFFLRQNDCYHETDYREFLKNELDIKKLSKDDVSNILILAERPDFRFDHPRSEEYSELLMYTFFPDFYHAMCYTLLRMIDCARDYDMIVDVCMFSLGKDTKMMSEGLLEYLKAVISKKTREPNNRVFRQLVQEPFEMKSIQTVIKSIVLGK